MGRQTKKRMDTNGDLSLGQKGSLSASIGSLLRGGEAGSETDAESLTPARDIPKSTEGVVGSMDAFLKKVQQVTLRRESAGRGGRVVTIVSTRPEADAMVKEALAKSMKKGLGCGARVEGRDIALQGDIQERTSAWLEKRGVKRVVMGN